MPNVPLSTRFVGFAPETNLQERKSANINALSQPFTMQDIANTVGGASAPSFTYSVTGGSVAPEWAPEIVYYIGSLQSENGGSGTITAQGYYLPYVKFYGPDNITSLTVPTQYALTYFLFSEDTVSALQSISFPNLVKVIKIPNNFEDIGGEISIRYCDNLTNISLPLLESGILNIDNLPQLTSLDISSCVNAYNNLVVIENCDLITFDGISYSNDFVNFQIDNCSSIDSFTSTSSSDICRLQIRNCNSLTSISVPNLIEWSNSLEFQNNSILEEVTIGTVGTIKSIYYSVNFYNCALSSASVTHILDVLVSLDGTNGTTDWGATNSQLDISGGTNAIPSAGDLVKIGILEGRGATVNYNS